MDIVPVGATSLVVCHWTQGSGQWEPITVNHSALNGHEQHDLDVWPPVEDITDGMNWPEGETLYLSNCTLATAPSESPSPTPTGTLPPTGAMAITIWALLGVLLVVAGMWLKHAEMWKPR